MALQRFIRPMVNRKGGLHPSCNFAVQHHVKDQPVLYQTTKLGYSSSADADYLHRSMLPSDYFQRSLPRLSIPKLEDTKQRYLKAQSVLLNPDEYKYTEDVVNKFVQGRGQDLHKELVSLDKNNKHTSYITGPWTDMYLKDRRAVALNHNPFMAFADDPKPAYMDQAIRCTNFIHSSMRFMKTLKANILEPEVYHLNPEKSDTQKFRRMMKFLPQSVAAYGAILMKAFPLDMSQYNRLFQSTRIPRDGKDELYTDESTRHLVVMRNGNIYVFDVLDENGNIKTPTEVLAHIKYILSDTTPEAEYPIGMFTAGDRDTWTVMRKKLIEAGNDEALNLVDTGMFVLSLDDNTPKGVSELCHQFLHGYGTNRWFDKSLSLLLAPDGHAAVNFEHAWGDGVAVLRYFTEVYGDMTKMPAVHPDSQPASVDSSKHVRRLDFNMTDEIKHSISKIKTDLNLKVSTLSFDLMEHTAHTKSMIKKEKLSPDSFLQLIIQLAFFKQTGKFVASYESCSTAAFRHGRTETIRPATVMTKKACEMFENRQNQPSLSELRGVLDECSKMHGQLTKEAAMGQGFDRHLFGLKHLASMEGELPDIFTDPAFVNINANIISTSTLSTDLLKIGGFAPVVPDGYGIGYTVSDTVMGCSVSAYDTRDVGEFVKCLESAFDDMFSVLDNKEFRK